MNKALAILSVVSAALMLSVGFICPLPSKAKTPVIVPPTMLLLSSTDNIPSSCKKILELNPISPDGDYQIDPDGAGGLAPFNVTCDMTTEGGGWTAIPYASDFPYQNHFTDGDQWRWLPSDFTLGLTDDQINSIRANATEGKQRYVGLCESVLHYYFSDAYVYAFGFRFHQGGETPFGSSSYAPYTTTVIADGCQTNGGEGGTLVNATIFDFQTTEVPIINVYSRDSGDIAELFGSPLTSNPAWLR